MKRWEDSVLLDFNSFCNDVCEVLAEVGDAIVAVLHHYDRKSRRKTPPVALRTVGKKVRVTIRWDADDGP